MEARNKRKNRPKAPLIRNLGYILSGILFFAILAYILFMSSY